jgi:N-methylhydantoinase B
LIDEPPRRMVRTSFSTLVTREAAELLPASHRCHGGMSLVRGEREHPELIGTLPETVKHFLRFFRRTSCPVTC